MSQYDISEGPPEQLYYSNVPRDYEITLRKSI